MLIVVVVLCWPSKKKCTCKIGKLTWDRNEFCRGWLITGATGSGKTFCGINTLLHQLFQNEAKGDVAADNANNHRPWGGVCIDEKGTYWEIIQQMAAYYQRRDDLLILKTRSTQNLKSKPPSVRFNLIGDDSIPATTYAANIAQTASTVTDGEGEKSFFKVQTEANIAKAIELLREAKRLQRQAGLAEEQSVTIGLDQVLDILLDRGTYDSFLERHGLIRAKNKPLEQVVIDGEPQGLVFQSSDGKTTASQFTAPRYTSEKLAQLLHHFAARYWAQPSEQLGGVQATIYNTLCYFSSDDVAEVFCRDSTFSFTDVDQGKIICVCMPQELQTERRYVSTLLKFLFYTHALRRFDLPKAQLAQCNLIVLWQDEGQRFISDADANVDVIREAKATTVIACQSQTSLIPPLGGRDKADVTLLNLRNRMIFRAADQSCARASAEFLGIKRRTRRTKTSGASGTTVTTSQEENYILPPSELRCLPDFTAIVCTAQGRFKRSIIGPKNAKNTLPSWWPNKLWQLSKISWLIHALKSF